MKKTTIENQQENLNGKSINEKSKIDAIKELIFWENIQEYNVEFDAVKADILSKKKELENLIDDIKSELMHSMDSIDTDLNIRITELEDSFNNKLEQVDKN